MKTYYSNEEISKDIVNGNLIVDDDIEIAFDGCSVAANIRCKNIISKGYKRNINAEYINAGDINAGNINTLYINARNINAWDINAGYINARNINARNINAGYINYYAVCFAINSFKCKSIEGRRKNSKHFCLDKEIEFKEQRHEC